MDVFLELSCFFDDPADVGNLVSGSSAFSKTSLNNEREVHGSRITEAWLGEFWALLCYRVRWLQGYRKTVALNIWTFVGRVVSLLFNTLSSFFLSFPAKKQSPSDFMVAVPSAVILEPKKRKSIPIFTFVPSICHEVGPRCYGVKCFVYLFVCLFVFWYLVLSWLFHSPPSPSSRVSLVPLTFCH